MVALSKPSLRSSARRNVGLESLATGIEVPISSTRSGKRTRESSLGNESTGSSKKIKSESKKDTSKDTALSNQDARYLPFRDKSYSQNAVTQPGRTRKVVPPLHTINGTTIPSTLQPEASRIASSAQTLNPPKQGEKRSLRSADGGSRSKSELALYIPNYDELVSLEAKQREHIDKDTLLHITDEPTISVNGSKNISRKGLASSKGNSNPASHFALEESFSGTIEWPEETFTILNDATRIEFSTAPSSSTKDPLDDSLYLKAHRREERQEKQLRNIEKERAMHEKVQLERLLDGLRGHDWLRTMGISGITETEKKLFEPKRDYCISYVRTLLDKFKLWKEEEKRRKVERETTEGDEEEDGEEDMQGEEQAEAGAQNDSSDYSDVDASAARQLHQEAKLARKSKSRSHHAAPGALPPETPFKSFFSKPYLREAAISKHRRGRSRYAFGQPIVEPQEKAFELPQNVLSSDALASIARRSRKNKRDMG